MVVGRGEKIYSRLLLKPLLGGTSCWDDRPPKIGNLRGNRWVYALRVEREGINIVAGRKATTHRGTKQVRLCLARVGVAQCGRQVHPDQTKADLFYPSMCRSLSSCHDINPFSLHSPSMHPTVPFQIASFGWSIIPAGRTSQKWLGQES